MKRKKLFKNIISLFLGLSLVATAIVPLKANAEVVNNTETSISEFGVYSYKQNGAFTKLGANAIVQASTEGGRDGECLGFKISGSAPDTVTATFTSSDDLSGYANNGTMTFKKASDKSLTNGNNYYFAFDGFGTPKNTTKVWYEKKISLSSLKTSDNTDISLSGISTSYTYRDKDYSLPHVTNISMNDGQGNAYQPGVVLEAGEPIQFVEQLEQGTGTKAGIEKFILRAAVNDKNENISQAYLDKDKWQLIANFSIGGAPSKVSLEGSVPISNQGTWKLDGIWFMNDSSQGGNNGFILDCANNTTFTANTHQTVNAAREGSTMSDIVSTSVAQSAATASQKGDEEFAVTNAATLATKPTDDEINGRNLLTTDVIEPTDTDDGGIKHNAQYLAQDMDKVNSVIANATDSDAAKVTIDMLDGALVPANIIPKEVLSIAAGKNVDITFDMGQYSWTINGKDILSLKDVNMSVAKDTNAVPADAVNSVSDGNNTMELSLKHTGDFGYSATLNISAPSNEGGKYANLYWYKPDHTFQFMDSGLVGNDSLVSLKFSHASDYVVVFSDTAMGEGNSDAVSTASTANKAPKTADSKDNMLFFYIVMIGAVATILAVRKYEKRN